MTWLQGLLSWVGICPLRIMRCTSKVYNFKSKLEYVVKGYDLGDAKLEGVINTTARIRFKLQIGLKVLPTLFSIASTASMIDIISSLPWSMKH